MDDLGHGGRPSCDLSHTGYVYSAVAKKKCFSKWKSSLLSSLVGKGAVQLLPLSPLAEPDQKGITEKYLSYVRTFVIFGYFTECQSENIHYYIIIITRVVMNYNKTLIFSYLILI